MFQLTGENGMDKQGQTQYVALTVSIVIIVCYPALDEDNLPVQVKHLGFKPKPEASLKLVKGRSSFWSYLSHCGKHKYTSS